MMVGKHGLRRNFVHQGRQGKLKRMSHKTNTCLKSTKSEDSRHDITMNVDINKHDCEYGRFRFSATKRQAEIFGATMFVIYLAGCVASTVFWTWLIEEFMI